MSTENLACSVSSCKYNNDFKCHAETIHVSGAIADTSNETCCSTYIHKDGMSVSCSSVTNSNNNNNNNSAGSNNIKCDALKCIYNNHELCSASHVHIDAPNVCCETFQML